MKKFLAFVLAVMMLALVGCAGNSGSHGSQSTPLTDDLETIVDKIYEKADPGFMVATIPVDIADTEWSLKAFTGLDANDKLKEAVASEAMIGSIPYSLVLVRLNSAADAKAVAEQMKSGIDQRKWICVEADDLMVSGYSDVVMLVMVGSEYASDGVTAKALTDAFAEVCGGKLDFTA